MSIRLAIHGGKPTVVYNGPHLIWPEITPKLEQAVIGQLHKAISIYDRSGIYEEFEEKFSHYHHVRYALGTSSGTAALYSIFVGAGLKEGDEIICPSYTFFATISPIFFTGAVPVLCEVQEDGNIDPNSIEKLLTPKTKAIIVTHMWGIPCEMDRITKIAKKHHLFLFEDCSHAHGATYKGKLVGTFGDAAAWSLQGQKNVTAGEGGIMLTRNKDIYYRAMLLGHFNKRCMKEINKNNKLYKFAVTGMGLKLRMHPLGAAIANEQFDYLDEWLKTKRKIAQRFDKAFSTMPGVRPAIKPAKSNPAWYAYVLRYIPEELGGLSIEGFFSALQVEGCIMLDRPNSTCPLNHHYLFKCPEKLFPSYKGKIKYKVGDFPVAEKFHKHSLKLPVWHDERYTELAEQYIEAFRKVTSYYVSTSKRL
ncbi:MAG: DegT/DnrJ/EryC1/StrS family aminotransferase [bacterium]|nr:DegT/DnrJ/EryC1/StrS family aminotransferase [bacterium]